MQYPERSRDRNKQRTNHRLHGQLGNGWHIREHHALHGDCVVWKQWRDKREYRRSDVWNWRCDFDRRRLGNEWRRRTADVASRHNYGYGSVGIRRKRGYCRWGVYGWRLGGSRQARWRTKLVVNRRQHELNEWRGHGNE